MDAKGNFSAQKAAQDIWKGEDLHKKFWLVFLSKVVRGTNDCFIPCSGRLAKETV